MDFYLKSGIIKNIKTNAYKGPDPKKERATKKVSQRDHIFQTLLQISNLLKGRFTFSEICNMDIPTIMKLSDNELLNIDTAMYNLKTYGIVNSYTRDESNRGSDKSLQEFDEALKSTIKK